MAAMDLAHLAITPDQCAREILRLRAHRGVRGITEKKIRDACAAYAHTPRSREWTAAELRQLAAFLTEVGFTPAPPLELGELLPPEARGAVEEANVFIWPTCAYELCVAPDTMFATFEALEMDKLKWSRRAPKTNGKQNKLARHNCCVTDLREPVRDPDPGDVDETRARHKHPKNPEIKFTNYGFAAVPTLATFRARLACVFGPFGYKVRGMYAEVNKYHNVRDLTKSAASGIGLHGDTERGGGRSPGAVCCLKLGAPLPLVFTWFARTKPAGTREGPSPADIDPAHPDMAVVENKGVAVLSAVAALGHGAFYCMSRKAVGFDWKKHALALRHCAGGAKYTGLPREYYTNLAAAFPPRWPTAYSVTFSDCVENDSETPELQFKTPFI